MYVYFWFLFIGSEQEPKILASKPEYFLNCSQACFSSSFLQMRSGQVLQNQEINFSTACNYWKENSMLNIINCIFMKVWEFRGTLSKHFFEI